MVLVNISVLTPQLRATLLRISQGLEAQRLKQSASMGAQPSIPIMGASVGVINSPGTQSDTPLSDVSGGGEIVMAPTNLYAVKVNSSCKRCLCKSRSYYLIWTARFLILILLTSFHCAKF